MAEEYLSESLKKLKNLRKLKLNARSLKIDYNAIIKLLAQKGVLEVNILFIPLNISLLLAFDDSLCECAKSRNCVGIGSSV